MPGLVQVVRFGVLRYSLQHIFLITSLFSCCLAAVAADRYAVAVFVTLASIGTIAFHDFRAPRRAAAILWGVVAIAASMLLLPQHDQFTPQATYRSRCRMNLVEIGIAMDSYLAKYHRPPPAVFYGPRGDPHSWRVLLLPFLGYESMYRSYRFDEPWNSPHNSAVASQMPKVYRCPDDICDNPFTASYLAVVGKETVWPDDPAKSVAVVTDGPSETLCLVERQDSGIAWNEPRDLPYADALSAKRPRAVHRSGADKNKMFRALFCSGDVTAIDPSIPTKDLKALLTKYGLEAVDWLHK